VLFRSRRTMPVDFTVPPLPSFDNIRQEATGILGTLPGSVNERGGSGGQGPDAPPRGSGRRPLLGASAGVTGPGTGAARPPGPRPPGGRRGSPPARGRP